MVKGPSLSDLVKAADTKTYTRLRAALAASFDTFAVMVKRAETVEAHDQMIGEGNKLIQSGIDALFNQTKNIKRAIAAPKLIPIQFEGSDGLDDLSKVAS